MPIFFPPKKATVYSGRALEFAQTMINELKCNIDAAINVVGDSTGDEDNEWVYQTAVNIATAYPKAAVVYSAWDDGIQAYRQRRVISPGVLGERKITFDGSGYRVLSHNDVIDVTGDMDIMIDIALANWTPASTINLCGKYASSGLYSWRFRLDSTGKPILAWSTNGTTLITATATTGVIAANGQRLQIRATLDVDNGSSGNTVTFYTRTVSTTVGAPAEAWSQLGAPVVTAGVTSIFSSAADYTIGGVPAGQAACDFYNFELRSGIGGALVHPASLTAWVYGAGTQGVTNGSPTLYIFNGSKSGANYTYFTDATRKTKIIPPFHGAVVIANDGHNEGAILGAAWYTILDTIKEAILAQNPSAKLIFLTQNPTTKSNSLSWDWRMHGIRVWADKNSIAYIDTYKAFIDDGRPLTELINQDDGIYLHPNAEGKIIETNAVSSVFLDAISDGG